jgi:capsular polysaccharide transport system permease protein
MGSEDKAGPQQKAAAPPVPDRPGPAGRQGGGMANGPAALANQQPGGLGKGPGNPLPGGPRPVNQQPGGPGKGPGQQKPGGPQPDGPPVNIQPVVPAAKMQRRHWRLLASFFLVVALPTILAACYLAIFAQDQYRSTTGFVVRQDEGNSAASSLSGLARFVGGSVASDGDVLFEFVQSQRLVAAVDAKLDIRSHYAQHWPGVGQWFTGDADPVFSLWPDASIEDLVDYWQRVVRVSFDQGTGLIEVQVLAFDPEMARAIAEEILTQSQVMINGLNDTARNDAMRYALADLETAVERLKTAREAMTQFRSRTQIVDPQADLQGRMGVMTNLQQQLAQSLIEFDLLQDSNNPSDPRVAQARRRIEVIQERIQSERNSFTGVDPTSAGAEDYPVLLAEYESLLVDREFAEETYRLALSAVEVARSNATRQSRYLATYIEPTAPETSEFPRRFMLVGLALLFLMLLWGVGALVYYSIRDRQ